MADCQHADQPDAGARLGLESRYYDFKVEPWRFIVVDGNDLSQYAWPEGSARYEESKRRHAENHADKPTWNGAVGAEQLAWIEKTIQERLASADAAAPVKGWMKDNRLIL